LATLIGLVVGVVALLLFVLVERQRAPQIEVKVGHRARGTGQFGTTTARWEFLHLEVRNQPLRGWHSILADAMGLDRRPAEDCQVHLTFIGMDGTQWIRDLPADWSHVPEPFDLVSGPQGVALVVNPGKIAARCSTDLYPRRQGSAAAVALKYDGSDECFGFNAQSYLTPSQPNDPRNWREPSYRLDRGEYFVEAFVQWGGRERVEWFLLRNLGTKIDDEKSFGLERTERRPVQLR
jgi:hypothetical protein